MDTFGGRLREERLRLGLTQPELGVLAGVQKLAQFNYEADKRSPDAAYLTAVAAAGVDVLYVLTGQRAIAAVPAASKPTLSADEVAVVESYRKASKDGRDLISMAAKAAEREVSNKKKRAA